jgi:putative DNA-invertase from lambdoid prophage Rac
LSQPLPTALYARVSTSDQDGTSQLVRLRQWASDTKHPRQVVVEEIDQATGRNVRRPGLARIMAEARGHRVRTVAVCKIDRWARSILDLNSTLHELRDLGVEFVAVDQGLRVSPDRSDATSKLMLDVLGAVAEWEASIISERTRESLAYKRDVEKVRLGRPPGSKDKKPRANKGYLARYAERRVVSEGAPP